MYKIFIFFIISFYHAIDKPVSRSVIEIVSIYSYNIASSAALKI